MAKDKEPDFYELEKHSPLPTLDEAASALEIRKVQRIQDQLAREQEVQARRAFMFPSLFINDDEFYFFGLRVCML